MQYDVKKARFISGHLISSMVNIEIYNDFFCHHSKLIHA